MWQSLHHSVNSNHQLNNYHHQSLAIDQVIQLLPILHVCFLVNKIAWNRLRGLILVLHTLTLRGSHHLGQCVFVHIECVPIDPLDTYDANAVQRHPLNGGSSTCNP